MMMLLRMHGLAVRWWRAMKPAGMAVMALTLAVALSGCAALQIDVDVYKGPLANTEETQQQQLASMALSAKPLIVAFRNRLLDEIRGDWATSLSPGVYPRDYISWDEWSRLHLYAGTSPRSDAVKEYARQATQLNGILSFYKNRGYCSRDPRRTSCAEDNSVDSTGFLHGRPDNGIESLSDELSKKLYAKPSRTGRKNAAALADAQNSEAAAEQAYDQLESALVDFAARVQFYINNQWVVAGDADLKDLGDRLRTLLETVSNTILVQADEMRRKDEHRSKQILLTQAESNASQRSRAQGEPAPLAPRPASPGSLNADDLAGLQASVEGRRSLALQSAYLFHLLPTSPANATITGFRPLPLPAAARLAELQRAVQQTLSAAAATVTAADLRQSLMTWAAGALAADADVPASVRQKWSENQMLGLAAQAARRLELPTDARPVARASAILVLRQSAARQAEKDIARFRSLDTEYQRYAREAAPPAAVQGTSAAGTATVAAAGPGLAAAGGALGARKPIDVVDEVIASLRYQHLEAIRSKGPESDEASNLGAALAQARKHRADMVYVRPSSAYLRSALPATFAQENPYVRWTNMLNDTIQNILRRTEKDPMEITREDLDKVFWQNINRVRVNAAGSTNYVVAKDDVGNWYVKGMGADPAAMVNAAKNLALFNMGGRLNANLMRIDELRGRMDSDTTAGPEQRQAWKDEIDSLSTGTESGGAVAERGQTLSVFRAIYDKATRDHFDALKAALSGDTLKNQVLEKWQATAPDAQAALAPILGRPDVDALLGQARDALATVPSGVTADAIITSLQALESYRRAVRAAVLAEPSLVSTQDVAVKTAQQAIVQATAQARDAFTTMQSRAASQSVTTAAFNAAVAAGAASAQIDSLRTAMNNASQAYQQALMDYEQKLSQQEGLRGELQKRQGDLVTAMQRRGRLGADANAVLGGLIESTVARRMRAVQELEAAANVVGRRAP